MKKTVTFLTAGIVLLLCTECPGSPNTTASYTINVTEITRTNAPALQSFAHATSGDDWLLFAGRTNKDALLGGIHNLNANYADSSFIPKFYCIMRVKLLQKIKKLAFIKRVFLNLYQL